MQGTSSFGGGDQLVSAASFAGVGAFAAVGYAFMTDAEIAGPGYELRTASIDWENTTAVVPTEDRQYNVPGPGNEPGPPNRKRVL
jgi:hypothetical protein